MARKRTRILSVAVSSGLLLYGGYLLRDSFPELLGTLQEADVFYLSAAWVSFVLATFVISLRLKMVFEIVGIEGRILDFTYYTFVAMFTSSFLRVPGGAALITALVAAADRKKPVQVCLVAGVADRLIGALTVPLLAAGGLWVVVADSETTKKATLLAFLSVGTAATALGVASLIPEESPIRDRLMDFCRKFRMVKLVRAMLVLLRSPRKLLQTGGVTAVVFFFYSFSAYLVAHALGFQIPFALFMVLVPTLSVAMVLPSVGGWGVRETVFILLLKPYLPLERALAVSLLYYAITVATGVLGGLAIMLRGWPEFARRPEEEDEAGDLE